MSSPADPRRDDFAQALVNLRPVTPTLDRDRLLFEAGRASLVPQNRRWRRAAVGLSALSLALILLLTLRTPATVERVVTIEKSAPPPVTSAPSIPTAGPTQPASPRSYGQLLQAWLEHPDAADALAPVVSATTVRSRAQAAAASDWQSRPILATILLSEGGF